LYDGKTIPNLCLEILELNENEKVLLNNIKQAIPGFFEVLACFFVLENNTIGEIV